MSLTQTAHAGHSGSWLASALLATMLLMGALFLMLLWPLWLMLLALCWLWRRSTRSDRSGRSGSPPRSATMVR